jgi:anti-sigma B factor antagonist
MRFKTKEHYNAIEIELKGNIIGGPETQDFHNMIKDFLAEGKKNIIVNLGSVKFMNSTGLGMLIGAFTSVKNADGKFVIAKATEKINSLLVMTKLITIFDNYQTIEEAIESFKK